MHALLASCVRGGLANTTNLKQLVRQLNYVRLQAKAMIVQLQEEEGQGEGLG